MATKIFLFLFLLNSNWLKINSTIISCVNFQNGNEKYHDIDLRSAVAAQFYVMELSDSSCSTSVGTTYIRPIFREIEEKCEFKSLFPKQYPIAFNMSNQEMMIIGFNQHLDENSKKKSINFRNILDTIHNNTFHHFTISSYNLNSFVLNGTRSFPYDDSKNIFCGIFVKGSCIRFCYNSPNFQFDSTTLTFTSPSSFLPTGGLKSETAIFDKISIGSNQTFENRVNQELSLKISKPKIALILFLVIATLCILLAGLYLFVRKALPSCFHLAFRNRNNLF